MFRGKHFLNNIESVTDMCDYFKIVGAKLAKCMSDFFSIVVAIYLGNGIKNCCLCLQVLIITSLAMYQLKINALIDKHLFSMEALQIYSQQFNDHLNLFIIYLLVQAFLYEMKSAEIMQFYKSKDFS